MRLFFDYWDTRITSTLQRLLPSDFRSSHSVTIELKINLLSGKKKKTKAKASFDFPQVHLTKLSKLKIILYKIKG